MVTRYNLLNIILIIIIFDNLYNNFKIIIASILKTKNKTIEEI